MLELELEVELELELEPELELEDRHDSNVVRESASESDPEVGEFKKLAAPSLYGWSVDNVRVFLVFFPFTCFLRRSGVFDVWLQRRRFFWAQVVAT